MFQKKWKALKLIAVLMAGIMVLNGLPGTAMRTVEASGASVAGSNEKQSGDWVAVADSGDDTLSYYYYIQQYQDEARPEHEVVVDVTEFEVTEPEVGDAVSGTKAYRNREGSKEGVDIAAKGELVTFVADVKESGLYSIELSYYPLAESNAQIMFGVYIDGELPFIEANSCILSRVYVNEEIQQDVNGDDLRPDAIQTPEWRTQFLYDQTGINGTLSFYLEKGQHEISLCFDGTPLLLEGMSLKQEPYMLSYQDYVSLYKQMGYAETRDVLEYYQAENYYQQSSSTLWPGYDRTSPMTQPFDYNNIKINYGGGSKWSSPGQWISWKVVAPEDGFYNIGMKYRQSYLDGLFSSRKIYIDGEVPFEELSSIRFDYTIQWKNKILGDKYDNAYSIYLTQGEHIITMENVVGDLHSTMSVLQNVISELNELYLSVIMITGSEPDRYRDYYLEKLLPDLSFELESNSQLLLEEAERLEGIVGNKGAETAFFEDIAYNLKSYSENIRDLTYKERIVNLKNDISSLSAKMTSYQEQALDIDYITLISSDMEMPKTTPNVWEWMKYQVGTFMASFKQKSHEEKKEEIRVWINTGTDQLKILQDMITDMFTPQTGITVDLELVQGTLVEATVAGNGPDVAIGIAADTVVNLAMRGALVDLSEFNGYEEILEEYIEGSEIPFRLEGKNYALPNSGSFNVMFVRTDIFEQMGLKIPQTWDEMYDVAQVLQRNNMSLGAVPSFATLLYQKGGKYFDEDLTKVLFDEDVAVESMIQNTEFYTKYGFPVTYDFVSRFRTGEMPIGISSYATYNTLKYSAPEISGLWEMYCVPGTLCEDGTVDYTQVGNDSVGVVTATGTVVQSSAGSAGTIMFATAEKRDAAWEFIKWWSGADAQTRYANDLEAVMGVSARYATQNMITLGAIGWNNKELTILEQQIERLQFIPIVPGNYYISRGLQNVSRGVIYDGANARELLTEWTIKINDEITRKRMEFNMNN